MAETTEERQTQGESKPKRKRRWLKRMLIVLAVLAGLVWASPYLISSGPGTALATRIASGRVRGTIHIDDISLRWTGRCRIVGLRVDDTDGREVLNVTEVSVATGLLGLIFRPERFDEVAVTEPRPVLYELPDGAWSLFRALESPGKKRDRKKERGPREPKPLPEPVGVATIEGGSVRIVRLDGQSLDVTDINGRLDLQTLNDLTGELSARMAGGRIVCSVSVTQFTDGYGVQLDQARGKAELKTDGDLDLSVLGAFLGREELAGRVTGNISATVGSGKSEAKLVIALTDLQAGRPGGLEVRPISFQLKGEVAGAKDLYAGKLKLSRGGDTLGATFEYEHVPARWRRLGWEQILPAIRKGEKLDLPGLKIEAKGDMDVAEIAQAIPALLNIRKGVRIVAGRLVVDDFLVEGGATPAVSVAIDLVGLVSERDGVRKSYEEITIYSLATIDRGIGLKVRHGSLRWGKDHLEFSGTAKQVKAEYEVDLSAIASRLGQLIDMGGFKPAGRLFGGVTVNFGDDRTDFTGSTQLAREDVIWTGQVTGHVETRTKLLHAQVNVSGVDLAKLSRLGLWDAKLLRRLGGTARLTVTVDRASAGKPIILAGDGGVIDLQIDGKPVGKTATTFKFAGVELAAAKTLTVDRASLVSPAGRIDASNIHCDFGEEFSVDGRIEATGELAEVLTLATPLAGWKEKPDVAGQASWTGNVSTAGDIIEFDGEGKIANFRAGSGAKAVREKLITFAQHFVIDKREDVLTLKKMNVESELVRVSAGGTVKWLATSRVLDVSGSYRGSWERLTKVLHAFRPDLATEVVLSGPAAGEFKITGPLHQPDIEPSFHGLDGSASIGWTEATLWGVPLGAATFKLTFAEGVARLPRTVIDSGEGKVRLGGSVDFTGKTPLLSIPGKRALLENVPINRKLGDSVLSRIIFFLHDSNKLTGRASLTTTDLSVPLGEGARLGATGSGHLDLSDLKIQPGKKSLLDELFGLASLKATGAKEMTVSGLDFEIREGRVHYENCTVVLAGVYDMKFTGSVGFDDTLEMTVWLPLTPALLQAVGLKVPGGLGRVLDNVRRVPVFIGGTRQKPKLDFSRVNVGEILKLLPNILDSILKPREKKPGDEGAKDPLKDILDEILKPRDRKPGDEGAKDPLKDILDEILKPRRDPKKAPADKPAPPASQPAPKKPEDQLLDLLEDILGGRKKDK